MISSTSPFPRDIVFSNKITIIIRERDLICLPDVFFLRWECSFFHFSSRESFGFMPVLGLQSGKLTVVTSVLMIKK
jgi:hypothetical protein